VLLLLISWAAGLAAYGIALLILRGEVLSFDNWMIIGSITLVAWLVSALLVTFPILRLMLSSRSVQAEKGMAPPPSAARRGRLPGSALCNQRPGVEPLARPS
jgi:hypothetical protein